MLGSGRIKALDNGSPVDIEQHVGPNHRKAFYGLTRAYIESTNKFEDVNLLAACILGEKKLITSNKVSIDTEIINLRGHRMNPEIEIFYTLNGDTPTLKSKKYNSSFEIALGTTIKALVIVNGKSMLLLEEFFGEQEGFTWNENKVNNVVLGEQAEEATITKGLVLNKGANFKGNGYVKLNKEVGASVTWYQENDGGAGTVDMIIRYSSKVLTSKGTFIKIIVNGKVVKSKLFLPNTDHWGQSWNSVIAPIQLDRGANTIKLETVENYGLIVDEIVIK